jgi:hypothetical protein
MFIADVMQSIIAPPLSQGRGEAGRGEVKEDAMLLDDMTRGPGFNARMQEIAAPLMKAAAWFQKKTGKRCIDFG